MPELNLDKIDLGGFGVNVEEEKQTQLNANMTEAVKLDPVKHAQVKQLSADSGVPEFAVQSNPAQVEHQLKLDKIDLTGMVERSPKTSNFLTSNVNNSVIAQEDVVSGLLEGIERTFDNIGDTIGIGFKQQLKGLQLSSVEQLPENTVDLVTRTLLPEGLKPLSGVISENIISTFDIETDDTIAEFKQETSERLIGEIVKLQEERQTLTPDDLNIVQEGIRAGVESLVNMTPGVALSLFTRSPNVLLSTIGVQTYSSSYADARAEGLSPEESQQFAMIDAAIEVGTEVLPTGTLERIITGKSKGLKKEALKFVVQEMGTEQLATLGQTINSYAFGLDEELENATSAQEIIEIQLRRQAVTAIATVVAGGTQIAAVSGVNKTIEKLTQTEQQKETQGQVEQRTIDKLNNDSEKSKLRELDKESFMQFIRDNDGENGTTVFIDGVQTALYLQSKTREEIEADPALKTLDNAVRESRATGADVAIPVDEFMGEVAGTEAFTQLRDSMTMSEETVSPFREEQHREETQKYVESIMAEAQENASEYVEAQEIFTQVRDQLIDSGAVNSANASVMAQIVPAWATAQARRSGKAVQQVYTEAGLTIEGPQTGEKARLEGELVLEQILFRGVREGAKEIDPNITWFAADEALAKSYSADGTTFNQDLDTGEVFDAGNDADFTSPLQFANRAMQQRGAENIDRDVALGFREKFLNEIEAHIQETTGDTEQDFVKLGRENHQFWSDERLKEITSDFLNGLGFDSVKLNEQGVETFGILKPQMDQQQFAQSPTGTGEVVEVSPESYTGEYPLADPPEYGDSNYAEQGGRIITTTPDAYGKLVREEIDTTDEDVRDNIEDLKSMMEMGREIDPPTLYVRGDQVVDHDGRHRAEAARELGIDEIPLLVIDLDGAPVPEDISSLISEDPSQHPRKTEFRQEQIEPKNLAVVHNIRAEGIAAAEDLGGLAAPSIAVTNVEKGGFTGFGEISLIADPSLLDDPTVRTFDADIYSARQPRSVDKLNGKKTRELTDAIEEANEGTGLRPIYEVSEIADLDKDATFNYWLTTIGKAPKLKKMKPTPLSKAVEGVSNSDLLESEELKNAVAKIYKKQVDKILGDNPTEAETELAMDIAADWFNVKIPEGVELRWLPESESYAYFKGDEQVSALYNMGSRMRSKRFAEVSYPKDLVHAGDYELDFTSPKKDLINKSMREVRKIREGFDQDKFSEDLSKKNQNKKLRAEFKEWLSETYSDLLVKKQLFKGFTPMGDRKYAEYTLNNVVREMTKTLTGGEGMNYGVASVRSRFANELSTKEKVQAARDQLVTSEEMETIKEEAAAKFEDALERLKPYYKFDTESWGYGSDVAEAITQGPKEIREVFGTSKEANEIINELGKYLATLPTEYFEAKAQRAVDFSEFDTAVVPKDASKKTIETLKSHGLKIKKYDPNVEGSRNEVIAKQSKLLFQNQQDTGAARGYYDPAKSVIRLTESADLSTFLHEFAHFMYEMEASGNTELNQSINNWYKRNGKEVAAEATNYLNGDFNALKQGERQSDKKVKVTEADVVNYLDTGSTGNTDVDNAVRRAVHEQFARGFETYLMEGKAPSIELRNAFRTFARWLSQIYQSLRGQLNVNLDNEMRQVFDRLLATEEQIAAAESRARVEPFFTDAAMAGMTEEEFADYQQRQSKVKDVQSETLRDKLIKELTRKNLAWWKEEVADLVDEQVSELEKERVYATAKRLKHVGSTGDTQQKIDNLKNELKEAEKQTTKIKKENDTVGQWIAKNGGLNREDMEAEGVDPAQFKERGKVFGKPLFPKKGGMTADDVAELLHDQGLIFEKDANEALDIINDMLMDDTSFIDESVEAELSNVENNIAQLEQEIQNLEQDQRNANIKLDHATVKEMIGEERTDKLGRTSTRIPDELRGMTAKGQEGVHPDEAAAFFGYSSGSEMLEDLVTAPPMKEVAEERAQSIMFSRHGDIFTDGTIEQQADEAVQNEERGKLILHELKILSRGTNTRSLDRKTMKSIAEERIGNLSFREIHPGKYRKAEVRAAQESARMLAEGNKEGAAQAKTRQALNYYLGMAATEAKNETVKIVDRMNRYNKKKVREEIQKAEGGYWEQIVKILNRFEFRKSATLTQVDQVNQDINTWAKERMEIDGDGLVLANVVLNESYVTHWKNVAYSDLQGINDSVKNIEHVARYANKLTRMGEEIEFNKLVDRWVTSMNDSVKTRFKSKRTDVVEGKKWGRWLMAQMTKIPFMASWLDGGERTGISHQVLVQPFTDAYNAEIKLWEEAGKPVMESIEGRDKETIKRHNRKIYIPEIDDNLYGHQILAVALNTGNEGNLKKMLLGEQWANPDNDAEITLQNPKLQAVLKHMTESDWNMVQMIWDQMDTLYPQLAEVHRRTTGLVPPRVEATPVETPYGTFRGGYYPVKYDPNRDQRAAQNEDRLNAETESMFSGGLSLQASVNTGATNERTGYYAPIRLSLDVVPSHFQETIHYITHHDPVREINRLTRDKRVADTIKEKLGPEEYAQLKPWLNDIAKDGREAPTKMFWDDILQRLRFGVTLGAMGFKASTGIIQISGLANTISEVGMKNTMLAMRSVLGSRTTMKQAWDFAVENSKVLEHRAQTMDREIKNAMKRIEGKRGVLAAVQEASMKHIALIQTYMVDLPSWHSAYIKGMSEWGDETRAFQYADWVIENVQGSGATKDLARIMRGQSETGRMFTMFMTFFSSLWNMERDLVKGTKSGLYSTTDVAAKAMFLFTIPVLFEMLMRGEFSQEPEDDEELTQTMLTKLAMYPVQSVPFIRDIANAVTGDFGYNISPMQSIIEQGTRTIPQLVERGFTDEEITKGQVKGATKFIGAATGIPGTGQAWATGEHLYDVIAEGEEFTMHQFLFGPERK